MFDGACAHAFSRFPVGSLTGEAYDAAKAAFADSWARDTLPDLPADMINDWEPETRSLFDTLARHGFKIVSVDNGEGELKARDQNKPSAKFLAETIACDEARLYVKRPDGQSAWLYLVLGNCPGELIADWSFKATDGQDGNPVDPMQAVSDEHAAQWDDKDQPRKVSIY